MDLIEYYRLRYKSWKRRWFILNDNCLYYFEFTTDKEPRGIIPLENISVSALMCLLPSSPFIILSPLIPLKSFPPLPLFPPYNYNLLLQIRDVTDRSKQHCFELFCSGNEVIKACKTDSDGKVTLLQLSPPKQNEKSF